MKVSSVSPLQVELKNRSMLYGTEFKYCSLHVHILKLGRHHLTMVILTILTMDFKINTKKNLKKGKNLMDMFFYLQIDSDSNFMQFHYHLIVHQRPSNYNRCKLYKILMVLDGVSNDN
jgi:hypothetical protein